MQQVDVGITLSLWTADGRPRRGLQSTCRRRKVEADKLTMINLHLCGRRLRIRVVVVVISVPLRAIGDCMQVLSPSSSCLCELQSGRYIGSRC